MSFIVKMARDKDEFEQIMNLNYETFVEEIPQHHINDRRKLLDRFHEENEYIICKENSEVIGMLALRDTRPFSLDEKLGSIENHLDIRFSKPCEVRLLAVKKSYRNGRVFAGLTGGLIRYCLQRGYDIAFISGTTRQSKLYRHLGFESFAHLVGSEEALFQPMYLTKQTYMNNKNLHVFTQISSYLPGPVTIDAEVQSAFDYQPVWHRSEEHSSIVQAVNKKLKSLTNAENVVVLTGSGTLSNDAVAAHLSGIGTKGLILSNGEFGERLIDHANRFHLQFDHLSYQWGERFDLNKIEEQIAQENYDWLWFVHCETSTGMVNDYLSLEKLCKNHTVKLCVDAISSIGAVPLNFESIYLATGVSGKAIGSYTGLSFVFFNKLEDTIYHIPRYLDIMYYQNSNGIPFSQNSNLFLALNTALNKFSNEDFYEKRRSIYFRACELFEEKGFSFVIDQQISSPCVITIELPKELSSLAFGEDLFLNGFLVHYRNRYLVEKNWLQIAFMNVESDLKKINLLINSMELLLNDQLQLI
ncbi:aminotransferase class V-fold PLP-dependent enzyme [Heyndrickxia vini]|uniref:Aminotransferase class V-fold PLP-dependent enzyme n=1 Tax=Heyndrickxia vini TaxID=1476025 RepID=A0ABX7DY38_9BACI|nr:aminotransferase class V-fold PLP-dependent enzyme [Heyndrickxia vini]QQZ07894.1 aminotransferase class V-fold PLP-dependent enzyme [Heyndrickxia vini]